MFPYHKAPPVFSHTPPPLTYIVVNLSIAALIWVGALRVDAGIITQGAVIALVNYMSQILVELVKLPFLSLLKQRHGNHHNTEHNHREYRDGNNKNQCRLHVDGKRHNHSCNEKNY